LALGAGWLGFPGLLWDVAWHRTIGRDSLLSPPHVLMYAGVVVNGLVSAWALVWGRRRYGAPGGLLLGGVGFLLAVAGAAPDAWGRTPDFYPFLLALFLPAIFMAATRALGPGAAAATAAIFTAEHVLILLALLAFGMRVPTFTPIPLLPALAIELAVAALPVP